MSTTIVIEKNATDQNKREIKTSTEGISFSYYQLPNDISHIVKNIAPFPKTYSHNMSLDAISVVSIGAEPYTTLYPFVISAIDLEYESQKFSLSISSLEKKGKGEKAITKAACLMDESP